MFSNQTLQELRDELATLRSRVAAILAILETDATAVAPLRRRRIPHATKAQKPQKATENGTFANDVRRALRAIGKTTTSADVSAWLDERGGSQHTKRPLRGAVAVELFRMAKKSGGGVKKVSRGRYRSDPVQEEGPHRVSSTGLH